MNTNKYTEKQLQFQLIIPLIHKDWFDLQFPFVLYYRTMTRRSVPQTTITVSVDAQKRYRKAAKARNLPLFAFMEILSLTALKHSLKLLIREEKEIEKNLQ